MKNRQLERNKDTVSNIIDDLVSEIEELEAINDTLVDQLDEANDKIEELMDKLDRLES